VPSCRDCPPPPLDSARAAFVYDGPARRAIHRLKFSGWRDVAAAMADAMAAVGPPAAADVVTWVPLARGRRAERGYDQARALAVALAHRLDLPAARLLRRSVATDPQARRSGAERRTAMRGVFRAVRAVPDRVLLVDDVLTTGATLAAAAEALCAGGAHEVHALAAARSLPGRASLRAAGRAAYPRVGSRSGLWLPGDVPR
jgi:ComF family protein